MKRRPNRSPLASQLVFLLLTISVVLAQVIPGGVRRDGALTLAADSAGQIAPAAFPPVFAAKKSNTDVVCDRGDAALLSQPLWQRAMSGLALRSQRVPSLVDLEVRLQI